MRKTFVGGLIALIAAVFGAASCAGTPGRAVGGTPPRGAAQAATPAGALSL